MYMQERREAVGPSLLYRVEVGASREETGNESVFSILPFSGSYHSERSVCERISQLQPPILQIHHMLIRTESC